MLPIQRVTSARRKHTLQLKYQIVHKNVIYIFIVNSFRNSLFHRPNTNHLICRHSRATVGLYAGETACFVLYRNPSVNRLNTNLSDSLHYTSPISLSSVVVFFCAVAMENLHHLTGCMGQFSLWRAEFHETYYNLLTCLSSHPLPRCFFSLKELCCALAHRTMYSFADFFFSIW